MRRNVFLYILSEVFLSFGLGIAWYALPFLYKSAGLSDASIGLLLGTNTAVSGIVGLLLGPMADRIGATRVVKFATLLLGLGYSLTGLVHTEAAWFGTTAINGLGGALLGSTENIVVSQLAEGQNRARVMSRFFAMYTFVIGAGALAAGPMSLYLGYQDTLLTGAVFSLVAPVIRYFVRLEDVRAHRMFKWPSRRLVAMSLYNLLYGIGFGLFNPFATLLLKGQFHLSDSVVAALSAMSTFTAALGGLLVAPLLNLLRPVRSIVLSYAISLLATLGLGWSGNPWTFSLCYLGRTAFNSIPGPIVDATFLEMTSPTEYAQMFGVRIFGNNIGNALGSFTGGYVLTDLGHGTLYLMSAGVFAAALTYLVLLLRVAQRSGRSRESLRSTVGVD
ncbi:hypothetical protein GCM10025857_10800 [Alicyclobacillus contaminans]|uniref:MFS transporter n=1 Tax=Alicyclobacillus contaminans TaxID=392016 RepID=UPI00040FA627|nr:MFS transporter [Alicyclobacillus contaminans]GMA49723.1 hypothetical protein GCM10025857_10800 [Alicyclobacillus contaminans]